LLCLSSQTQFQLQIVRFQKAKFTRSVRVAPHSTALNPQGTLTEEEYYEPMTAVRFKKSATLRRNAHSPNPSILLAFVRGPE